MEEGRDKTYWFMQMRQGEGGEDHAPELWGEGLVGVMFGTWRIGHVLSDGTPDTDKLTAQAIESQVPQPSGLDKGKGMNDRFLRAPRTLLLKMSVGHRVVVLFDKAIHIGTVGDGYLDDPGGPRGPYDEYYKCRPVDDQKSFRLADLPASCRLLGGMGRSTIQGIHAYEGLVRLLDEHCNADEIKVAILDMPTLSFLGTLSYKQWEVLCDQYLRDEVGLRSLVLKIGGTLQGVDIYGVAGDGKRLLAQCKNDSDPWSRKRLVKLISGIPRRPEDHLYFCCRGGVKGGRDGLDCRVVDGNDISQWLDEDPDYLKRLKTM